MSVAHAIQRLCSVKRDAVPPWVRRRELMELAAVVATALLTQAFVLPRASSGGAWLHILLAVALPWGAAWTLRRTAGRPAAAAAAILSLGLLGMLVIVAPQDAARKLTANAYVSIAMVWILASDRRASVGTVTAGAGLIAVAFALAAVI